MFQNTIFIGFQFSVLLFHCLITTFMKVLLITIKLIISNKIKSSNHVLHVTRDAGWFFKVQLLFSGRAI